MRNIGELIMDNKDYVGWKLFDKVHLVCKYQTPYAYSSRPSMKFEGEIAYVVPEGDKSMLKRARDWATWIEYGPSIKNEDTNHWTYEWTKKHDPIEYIYDNKDFTLELYAVAENSSQGGKLSFWNCRITAPDNKVFLTAISTNLLLEILQQNDFSNGICKSPMMFARCKGGVGMLSESMPSYQAALSDMETKKNLSKGKTKNPPIGATHITPTCSNVYLGTYYQWCAPIHKCDDKYRMRDKLIGFKVLKKPIERYYYPTYSTTKTKLSDYVEGRIWRDDFVKSIPSRAVGSTTVEIDVSPETVISKLNSNFIDALNESLTPGGCGNTNYSLLYHAVNVGISDSKDFYDLPISIKYPLLENGYEIIYE